MALDSGPWLGDHAHQLLQRPLTDFKGCWTPLRARGKPCICGHLHCSHPPCTSRSTGPKHRNAPLPWPPGHDYWQFSPQGQAEARDPLRKLPKEESFCNIKATFANLGYWGKPIPSIHYISVGLNYAPPAQPLPLVSFLPWSVQGVLSSSFLFRSFNVICTLFSSFWNFYSLVNKNPKSSHTSEFSPLCLME